MALTDELKALAAQHMPALVAGEMKTYIEQAEKNTKLLAEADANNKRYCEELDGLRVQIRLQEDLANRESVLRTQLEELRARELALVTATVKNEVAVLQASLCATNSTVDKFLKLPSVRTNVMERVGVSVPGAPGNQYNQGTAGFVQATDQNSTTTTTEE